MIEQECAQSSEFFASSRSSRAPMHAARNDVAVAGVLTAYG
jgi:hypothetical protein